MLLLWYGLDVEDDITPPVSFGGGQVVPLIKKKPLNDEEILAIILSQHLAQTKWKEDKKN